jgi:hypothetical protein
LFSYHHLSSPLALLQAQALPRGHDDAAPEPTETLQETITFFTADGIVRIPGRMLEVPRSSSSSSRRQARQPMPSWEEQRLCIGQTFEVAAWNARWVREGWMRVW